MRLYGFFRGKPLNILEDVAHIFIGLVPLVGWTREHFQWPPGDTVWIRPNAGPPAHYVGYDRATPHSGYKPYAPHDRVADSYRDFLGYAIGGTIRTAVMVGLLIWKW